jgi:hypothetical protein
LDTIVVENNTRNVAEFTWMKVKAYYMEINSHRLAEYLNSVNIEGNSFINVLCKSNDSKKLKFFWNELILIYQKF